MDTSQQQALDIIETARKTAEDLLSKTKEDTSKMIVESIKQAFGEGEEEKKILLLNRVPYICEDIRTIQKDIKFIMKYLFMGMGGLAVLSFLVPLLIQYIFK